MKKLILLGILLVGYCSNSFSQKASLRFSTKMAQTFQRSLHTDFSKNYKQASWRYFRQLPILSESPYYSTIPEIYDYQALAFFCKVEVKLEKAVSFPIKFRLGDVQYVDRLEGKINY